MKTFYHFTLMAVLTLAPIFTNAQSTSSKDAEEAKMMASWMAYMTPGEMHRHLAEANGSWSAEITMWMAAGAPPQTNKATCENSMILGGRYQQSLNHGDFNGMPFEGISTCGYDNTLKKFVSTWIDNMGTGILYMEGSYDAKTKTINFTGKMVDPMSGKSLPVRETFTFIDDHNQVMEMFTTDKGKEYKSMNIKYSRNH